MLRALPLLLLLLFASRPLGADEELRIVDRFDDGVQNQLGGYRSGFQRSPSRVNVRRVESVRRGDSGKSIRVEAVKQSRGFCGMWIHLFDMRKPQAAFFDGRPYDYLSFWVRGEKGGEQFHVQLADHNWHVKEDSLPLGDVDRFLPGGITTDWQEVLVPLHGTRLERGQLASLVMNFRVPGEHTVYLDDVCFKSAGDVATPLGHYLPPRDARRSRVRSLWVWCTEEVLRNADREQELFQFCEQERIGVLWVQLPYDVRRTAAVPDAGRGLPDSSKLKQPSAKVQCVLRDEVALRKFLARAHRAGLRVHALDGYPEFAQREFHATPLAVVDAVVEFNDESATDARFDGVHFDNEPYLLLGWLDKEMRERILKEYLELNVECQRRVRARPGLAYGVDIPFWWQAEDEEYGGRVGDVRFRGVRKPASYHLIDLLDHVGVMNYRDQADGADGMIAHAKDILRYADQARKASIDLGVETFAYEPTPVWFAVGLPKADFLARLRDEGAAFAKLSRFRGARLRTLDDGKRIHVGVELDRSLQTAAGEPNQRARAILTQLCRVFSASPSECSDEQLERQFIRLHEFVAGVEGWRDLRRLDIRMDSPQQERPGFIASSKMLSKITFADDPYDELRWQVDATDKYFRRYASYNGIAIHCFAAASKMRLLFSRAKNGAAPAE